MYCIVPLVRSYTFGGLTFWNELHDDLHTAFSVAPFGKNLISYLFAKAFHYCVSDLAECPVEATIAVAISVQGMIRISPQI